MAKSRSRAVADAQAKVVAAGGARLTFTLNAAEAARWRELAARYANQKTALMASVDAALSGEVTPEEALRVLTKVVQGRAK